MLAQTIVCRELVGRKAELALLGERRREASQGRGGLVLISGEAGIGKTRLLAEFGESLASARVRVVASQCRQFAQRPYAPVLDAIGRIDPSAGRIAPAGSRDEQFENTVAAYLAAAKRGGIVALIEDIHWTDPATIELLATLGTAAERERLLVVVTFRPDIFDENDPMFAALGRLATVRNAGLIDLRALQRSEIAELIDHALEGAAGLSSATRKAVARLSEGNPLFAEELLKNAVERERAGVEGGALPRTIRAAVLERLAPLGPEERDVLAHAAVIGREFDADLLEAALGLPRERIRVALRHARMHQLVVEGRPGQFRFRHALTRETIYESFLDVQLRELHRRIAAALEAKPAEERSVQALAYHWWAGRDPERAVTFGVQAGDEARALYAFDEAIRFYSYALEFTVRDSEQSVAVRRKMMAAYVRNQERAEALRVAAETVQILERVGDLEQECDVRLEWASALHNLGNADATKPLIDMSRRLTKPEHDALRTRLNSARAEMLANAGRDEEASALLEAIGNVPPDAQPKVRIAYFAARALLRLHASDIDGYLENMKRVLQSARDLPEPNPAAACLSNMTSVCTRVGRHDQAEEFQREAMAVALQEHQRGLVAILLASEAALLYRRGDLSTAKTRLVESLEIGTDHSSASMQRAVYGTAVAVLTGDEELLERCHDQARAKSDDQVGFVAFSYAERLAAAGRTIEAAELLHRAVPSVGCGNHAPFELAIAIARWGTLEDAERARAQFERFADPASRPLREACLTLIDAYVAARTGRPEVKALGLVAAAAFSALGLPLWEADGLRLGGETDRAMAIYERIGAVARRWELERRMAIAPEAGEGESLLTGREREVAELVASGLSNAEIAAKLFVTVKAVEKHLGSIYKKLHFSSRSKLIVYMKAG